MYLSSDTGFFNQNLCICTQTSNCSSNVLINKESLVYCFCFLKWFDFPFNSKNNPFCTL